MGTAFDPNHITHLADLMWVWAAELLPRVAAAVAIVVVGVVLVRWLNRALSGGLARAHNMDSTLRPILLSVVRYALLIAVMIGALSQLGVQTTSLLAILGAAGLAIGLALQGTLANIAAGIMLLWLRPFQVGDFIEVAGQSGVVEEIGLFVSQLRTFDGLFLFMPNSTIWNSALKNYTRNGGRLVTINVAVPAAADIDRVRQTLLEVAARTPSTLADPPPAVFLDNVGGGAMMLTLAVWAMPRGTGTVERAIIENAKRALEALGEGFGPSQIARATPSDTDPLRFLQMRPPTG